MSSPRVRRRLSASPLVQRRGGRRSRTNSNSSLGSENGSGPTQVDTKNVFVKFLPADVTDTHLYEMFLEFGDIISAKVMVDHQTGHSLGYGFVRYYDEAHAAAAIEGMSGKKVENKTLLCKLSNCPTNPSTANLHPDTNLYIKPLLESTTEEELCSLFASFGEIEECKVMVDKHTGSSRQIGFVRFTRQEDATAAMTAMNGQRLQEESSPLIVRYAETETQKSARKMRNVAKQHGSGGFYPVYPQMSTTPPGYPMHDPGMYGMGYGIPVSPVGSPRMVPMMAPPHMIPPHMQQPHMQAAHMQQPMILLHTPPGSPTYSHMMHSPPVGRQVPMMMANPPMMAHTPPHPATTPMAIPQMGPPMMAQPPLSMSPIPLSPSRFSHVPTGEPNLFVFHLPADVDDEGLRALFEPFGPLESVKVIEDKNTKESKGYGFVKYQLFDHAVHAVNSMNGYPIGNKHLKVSFKTSN